MTTAGGTPEGQPEGVADALPRLAQLLATSPHNLVSAGERNRLLELHLPECVAVGQAVAPQAGERWVDLGTGGGLPGLVLALLAPRSSFLLVDATRKKAQAVEGFARALALSNVSALAARAEVLGRDRVHRGRADAVIARALAPLGVAIELTRPLVRAGGRIILVKGPRVAEELAEAEGAGLWRRVAVELLGVEAVPDAPRPTVLVHARALGTVPTWLPRRDGLARTEPLVSSEARTRRKSEG
jgi:16S rRNA (guanine527-N7)-methyltransferase